jgi:hypothetical protein
MRRLAVFLLLFPLVATAAPAPETWMSVLLGGRKIGSMHTTREVRGERVVTTQKMQIEFDRAGTKVALVTSELDEETLAGEPLAFESRTQLSGAENRVRGVVRGDSVDAHLSIGGAEQQRTLSWPKGALLAEGLRLAEARAGTEPGTTYATLAFQPENLDAIAIDSTIGPAEQIDLPDGARRLTRVDQIIRLPGAPSKSTAWIDADQTVVKLVMPVMGYELTMLACSRECAQAPNQSADILVHALVPAPRALDARVRRHGIVLTLQATDAGEPLQFAQTDEQRVTRRGDDIEVTIRPADALPAAEDRPTPADTRATDWLQSTAAPIRALANEAAGESRGAAEQMRKLEEFVHGYIRNKDLSVGYASALEVAQRPEGDCTEHAVLLAALGRARGIPTRVVDGLVYVEAYAGARNVFVPHAWVQAYVDGRWRGYDAALRGFDAGHLALSVGDGDPWRFFAGFNSLGRMRIEAVAPVAGD